MKVKFSNNPDVQFEHSSNPDFKHISMEITIKIDIQGIGEESLEELRLKLLITNRSMGFYLDENRIRFEYKDDISVGENSIGVQYYTDLDNPALMGSIVMRAYLIKRTVGFADRVESWDQETFNINHTL